MNATEVASPPTAYPGYYSNLPSKRRASPARLPILYKLASESSQESDDSGSETTLSIQGKETDLAKDTSDTDWSSEDAGDVIEFDVVSSAEETTEVCSQVVEGDGSSDTDHVAATVMEITMFNEGDFLFADSEDSDIDIRTFSNIKKTPFGYTACTQCKNLNNNPMYPYCEKCYKVRKDFFPPRPKRKKRKSDCLINSKKVKLLKLGSIDDTSSTDMQSQSTESLDFQNIIIPPSLKDDTALDSVDFSSEKAESVKSGSISSDTELCMVCMKEPKSGVFVHGRIAHICCCYKCSVKVWVKMKRCPICNCKVSNVLRAFVM